MTSRTFRKTFSLLLAALLFVSLSSGVLSGRALAASSFKDVPSGSYYSKAVSEMSSAGLVTGYKDGTFRPANYVTSAEALALVCSVGGISCILLTNPGTDISAIKSIAAMHASVDSIRRGVSRSFPNAGIAEYGSAEDCFSALKKGETDAAIVACPAPPGL
jgi:hypothetical protein